MARNVKRSDGETIDIELAFAEVYDKVNKLLNTSATIDTVNIGEISVSDYNTASESKKATIGASASPSIFAQDVTELMVQNTHASNTLYININGTTATTDDWEIGPGDVHIFSRKIVKNTGISLIASGAGTVVKMLGNYTPAA